MHDLKRDYHFNLVFSGAFSQSSDFDAPMWLIGSGDSIDSSGTFLAHNMTVRLKVVPSG